MPMLLIIVIVSFVAIVFWFGLSLPETRATDRSNSFTTGEQTREEGEYHPSPMKERD